MARHAAYMTTTRVHGSGEELWDESGWIDYHWDSGRIIWENRESVSPVEEITDDELVDDDMTFEEWRDEIVRKYFGQCALDHDTSGDGYTYYNSDEFLTRHSLEGEYTDLLAIHFVIGE